MPKKIIIENRSAWEVQPEKNNDSNKLLDYVKNRFPNQLNFSIKQTAQILNISEDFLRDRIANKLIHVNKFGRYYQLNILELARLLEEGVE